MKTLTWLLISLFNNAVIDKYYGTYDEAYEYFNGKETLNDRINYSVNIVSASKHFGF